MRQHKTRGACLWAYSGSPELRSHSITSERTTAEYVNGVSLSMITIALCVLLSSAQNPADALGSQCKHVLKCRWTSLLIPKATGRDKSMRRH